MSCEAFVLTQESREKLAKQFPPKFPVWIGHHVTHRFGVPNTPNVPYGEQTHGNFEVIGYAEGDGIEALVVRVVGRTSRPDGGTYHITWSLDPAKDRRPKDSNALIAKRGWEVVGPVGFDAAFDYIQ
jgi:hypothetical protein